MDAPSSTLNRSTTDLNTLPTGPSDGRGRPHVANRPDRILSGACHDSIAETMLVVESTIRTAGPTVRLFSCDLVVARGERPHRAGEASFGPVYGLCADGSECGMAVTAPERAHSSGLLADVVALPSHSMDVPVLK